MKQLVTKLGAVGLVVMLSGAAAYAQQALGTAFTYQGVLDRSGSPVNATADFQFSLFDAASAGNLVAGPVSVNNVSVADGLFTVSIDFGATAWSGQARWLSIAVRSPAGGGAFTTLSTRQKLTAAPYALKVPGIDGFSLDAADGSPTDALFVDNTGKVGIGTSSPERVLHTVGDAVLIERAANTPAVMLRNKLNGQIDAQFGLESTTANDGYAFVTDQSLVRTLYMRGGNVGVGVDAPTQKLHVNGGAIMVTNLGDQADALWLGIERSWVFRQEGTGAGTALKLQSIGGGGNKNFLIQTDGFVGVGTLNPQAKLDVNGTARANVVEITGADLAEKFPASEKLEPGTVVAIDPRNPGKMCMARGAYNRCVAGVVSGGNDFAAGAVLGNLPGHEDAPPVALSGRVYVHCDAASVAIQPGDLLTTSDTPGHAMKALDRERSHGAVIGKAMTALESGRGMVLVLVNLQ